MSVLKDITTNKDGQSFCSIRIIMVGASAFLTLAVFISLGLDYYVYLYSIINQLKVIPTAPKFDALGYGGAITGIISGGGLGILAKKSTEPDEELTNAAT